MVSNISFPSTIRQTLQRLGKNPLHFCLLQIPAAAHVFLEEFLMGAFPGQTKIAQAIGLPFLFVLGAISTGATFFSVGMTPAGTRPSARVALTKAVQNVGKLFPVVLLVGAATYIGFIAFIVPGVYFGAIYLFVVQEVMIDPDEPTMTYLNRSKKFSQGRLALHMGIFVIATFLLAWVHFVKDATTSYLGASFSLLLAFFLYSVLGAVIDTFLCLYFSLRKSLSETDGSLE